MVLNVRPPSRDAADQTSKLPSMYEDFQMSARSPRGEYFMARCPKPVALPGSCAASTGGRQVRPPSSVTDTIIVLSACRAMAYRPCELGSADRTMMEIGRAHV